MAQGGGRTSEQATPHRAQSRGQLVEIERFADIIVRAGVQTHYAVPTVIARRQDHHADIHVALSNETQHRKAVAVRKTQVQHDRIERRAFQRREGVLDPPDDLDRPATGAEPDLEAVSENGIVFYGEQSHAL